MITSNNPIFQFFLIFLSQELFLTLFSLINFNELLLELGNKQDCLLLDLSLFFLSILAAAFI